MFSRRTGALLLVVILLGIAMGRVLWERQPLCALTRQTFFRRAPIAGASGTNTFLCSAMYKGLPPADKVLGEGWALALLALLRSVAIDRDVRRRRRLSDVDLSN